MKSKDALNLFAYKISDNEIMTIIMYLLLYVK